MMKSDLFAITNSKNEVTRILDWDSSGVVLVLKNLDTRRVEVLAKSQLAADNKRKFGILREITKSEVKKNSISIDANNQIAYVGKAKDKILWANDVQAKAEEEDRLPFYLKRTSQVYVGALALILLLSFVIGYFTTKNPELVAVTVYKQDRPVEARRTVPPSRKPIEKLVAKANRSNPRKVVAKNLNRSTKSRNVRVKTDRPALNPKDSGPLAIFGGMAKKYKSAGGLNLNSNSTKSGLGKSGAAAKGGNSRGLVGAGLVVAGSGSDNKMVGYNGSSATGLGGGGAGYGSQKIGGSSDGYYNPMSEDSFVEGGLDQDQINAVVQRNIGQVLYCYEQGLQTKPKLSGRVAVHFVIGGSGSVNSAKVSNTSLNSSQVETCILSKLRNWKFPKPVGQVNVRVTYPFALKRLSQG